MPIDIRSAHTDDKLEILKCLDAFNDYANEVDGHPEAIPSHFSEENSGELFEKIINSNTSKLFIATDEEKVVGFLEIHAVPRLRKANYYAEIESLFVKEAYRGAGVAAKLMETAIEWAKQQKFDCIRLYTGHKLERAHAFYEKMGFTHAGRTYKFSLI
jgi:ribosomal protein S18 acetylase RimI-like enzyme